MPRKSRRKSGRKRKYSRRSLSRSRTGRKRKYSRSPSRSRKQIGKTAKWNTLKHNGPLFPPSYKALPKSVNFYYNDRRVKLSRKAEEVATFYAKMLKERYTKLARFNQNFMNDWKEEMSAREKRLIKKISACDFQDIHEYFVELSESRRKRPKRVIQAEKKRLEKLNKKYAFCIVDGRKQKIGNFRIEPPGLFRGRGNHPKMGKLKKRIKPGDVTINIGKGCRVPKPSAPGKWKEVIRDNTVTWLASWFDNIACSNKYIFLSQSACLRVKGDIQKYEIARQLDAHIGRIRRSYARGMKQRDPHRKQLSVALFLIDRLALRIGNEKGKDTADTVGCCSLRKEHVKLKKKGSSYFIELNFRSKDSMEYKNTIKVSKVVYVALNSMMEGKWAKDKLFDEITPHALNQHLQETMDGLTAKVFRTYHVSKTFEEKLHKYTRANMNLDEKLRAYEWANYDVAVLCNHRRAPAKNFARQTKKLISKISKKKKQIQKLKAEVKNLRRGRKSPKQYKMMKQRKKRRLEKCKKQLKKLELRGERRRKTKYVALGTSKLNYCDPRITVAWCKTFNVPTEKIYTKAQREKFHWAIDGAKESFEF